MRGAILGSGIVGLIAKLIFPDFEIVPFRKSRFYLYNPPLADNYISRHKIIDDFMLSLDQSANQRFLYKRSLSIGGQLLNIDSISIEQWLRKVYGTAVPKHAAKYYASSNTFEIYGTRVNQLYEKLLNKFMDDLRHGAAKGAVSSIKDHTIVRNGVTQEFDTIISTISLDALLSLMGAPDVLEKRAMHCIHVRTSELNFEGSNQVLVADNLIDFFKVNRIAPDRYVFYSVKDIPLPGIYFQQFARDVEILDGTVINDGLMLGDYYNQDKFSNHGIKLIGGSAQWDQCADVGSSILRLMKLRG